MLSTLVTQSRMACARASPEPGGGEAVGRSASGATRHANLARGAALRAPLGGYLGGLHHPRMLGSAPVIGMRRCVPIAPQGTRPPHEQPPASGYPLPAAPPLARRHPQHRPLTSLVASFRVAVP